LSHHRLFVAIRPPAAVRRALLSLMGGVPGARWQDDAQLHCTLRFIGEVDRHQAKDIAAALGNVTCPTLTLAFGPAGTFDRNGRVDTLWIGLTPRERLTALHDRIDQALRGVGIAPDDRAYVPHVTLARFARGEAVLPEVAGYLPVPVGLGFEATHFELMESRLGSEGAIYETVARYALTSET
jgi:RNA 2',3'-cyclic 3'-phosphodiesterase